MVAVAPLALQVPTSNPCAAAATGLLVLAIEPDKLTFEKAR